MVLGAASLVIVGSAGAQARPAASKASPASAPSAAPTSGTKLGFVNFRAALQGAPGYAAAESTFAKDVEGFRAEIGKVQANMDSLAQDFEQQSVVLAPTARQAKRKELEGKQQAAEQKVQELQQKAQARERELLEPIQTKVNGAVEAVRAEGGFAMIFDVSSQSSTILTADRTLDLTAKVIQKVKGS
jgi:outer membrane protein